MCLNKVLLRPLRFPLSFLAGRKYFGEGTTPPPLPGFTLVLNEPGTERSAESWVELGVLRIIIADEWCLGRLLQNDPF